MDFPIKQIIWTPKISCENSLFTFYLLSSLVIDCLLSIITDILPGMLERINSGLFVVSLWK